MLVTESGGAIDKVSVTTLSSGFKSVANDSISTVSITTSGSATTQRSGSSIDLVSVATLSDGVAHRFGSSVSPVSVALTSDGFVTFFGSSVGIVSVSGLSSGTKSTSGAAIAVVNVLGLAEGEFEITTSGIAQVSVAPFAAATFVPEVRFDNLYWNWPLYSDYGGYRVFYTRPGDHWREGRSKRIGAKATFRFYGSRVRIVLPQNLYRGIAKVFIDGELVVQQDLFDAASEDFIHDILDLEPGLHEVAIYPTGRSNPAAQDSIVQVGEFYYKHHVATEDQGEEIRERAWSASTSGG